MATKTNDKAKQSEEIVLLSVRNRKKSIGISWTQGTDPVSREFHDQPLESFYKALEALAPHVCTLGEFPTKDSEKIIATGLTLRPEGDNVLVLVVAKKTLKRGGRCLNIATPLLRLEEDSENANAVHMNPDEAKAVEKVIKETLRYLAGERGQGKIDFQGEADDEKEPDKKDGDKKGAELPFEPPASAEA
jgi:hypothetical protein